MSALVQSFSMVAIAEIGDKTQLLSVMLAARYQRFWPILGGIFVATLLNHALVAWLGGSLGNWLNPEWVKMGSALAFIAIGLWALIPDKAPEEKADQAAENVFIASLVAFFIAEMGDKTQLATLTLGADLKAPLIITVGTTLGMLAANIPALLFGEVILQKLPLKAIRYIACTMFISFGLWILIS